MRAGLLWRTELETYHGMTVGCAPGSHAAAVQLILRHVRATEGVLDCGAREGALLARLREAGFRDLNAVDLDVSMMKLAEVPVRRIDLNTAFATHFKRKFKLVCCTDVIEHLDSPRNFLIQARALLEEGGHLCVSLPNIAFWAGRIKFAVRGEHWGFGERNYREQRHISPMTYDAMRLTMAECGFRLLGSVTAGSFSGPVQKVALAPLAGLFRLIGGARALGETAIYLAQRAEPEAELASPMHYESWKLERMPIEEPIGGRLGEVIMSAERDENTSAD